MTRTRSAHLRTAVGAFATLLVHQAGIARAQQVYTVRNNHDLPYTGPVDVRTDLAIGSYEGEGAYLTMAGRGVGRLFVSLGPKQAVTLRAARGTASADSGSFVATPSSGTIALQWRAASLGDIALGLAAIQGTNATVDDAVRSFEPLPLAWTRDRNGDLNARELQGDYVVQVNARPHPSGFLDVSATVVRASGDGSPAYLALVRRVVTHGARGAQMRFNGRVLADATSPATWDRDFWYTRGVDWLGWHAGSASLVAVNRFTPVPSIKKGERWQEGSHFHVWERTRQAGDTMYLVSEIAGPNPDQAKSAYMPVTQYAPLSLNDTVSLGWRLAVTGAPTTQWEESQLRVFAGSHLTTREREKLFTDLGVHDVMFGIGFFPYSTYAENFDYYRVPGLTSENFWPIAPPMWRQWRRFIPRMKTDLRIIRAMGFDVVRLHHLELLQTMPRKEAFAFLDFLADESRTLGMKWWMDSEGPPEWMTAVLTRYQQDIIRVELENEVLIAATKEADPARWTELYHAAKAAAPQAQILLTTAGNNGKFELLKSLGVPFDRVGLHAYKHGRQWPEAYSSHMLATGGYATDIGKAASLGEWNWKDLTRLSPDVRQKEFATIYGKVLEPRAIGEVMEFQFQEQAAFNPSVGGTMSRHYEPVGMDRRPKPEAFEAMKQMRQYERADAPTQLLPITIGEVAIVNGRAVAPVSVTNATGKAVTITLVPSAFDGTTSKLLTTSKLTIASGATAHARVALTHGKSMGPGTYHHFVEARGAAITAMGWGVIRHEGAPTFADTTVLGSDRVTYAQGLGVVHQLDWSRPLAVVFGDKTVALELEEAFQLANTLQAATGRPVYISAAQDLPDSLARKGLVFVVGTATTNALVAETKTTVTAGQGTIALTREGGRQWLALTGADAKGVEAAVVELELRYWPNAKDAAIRLVGMERGAALGNRTGGSNVDLP